MPRRGLNTAAVVEAAAALADAEGVERLTLARLGERLEVSSPALYKHVKGMEGLQREPAAHGAELLADHHLHDALANGNLNPGNYGLINVYESVWPVALAVLLAAYARRHPPALAAGR